VRPSRLRQVPPTSGVASPPVGSCQTGDGRENSTWREEDSCSSHPPRSRVSVTAPGDARPGNRVWDLTYAEWESRRQLRQLVAFPCGVTCPVFPMRYVAQSGVQVGVRKTPADHGEYQLTVRTICSAPANRGRRSPGQLSGRYSQPTGKGTVLKRAAAGEAYDIPLRCLLPQGVERVVVAARCISGTTEAHSSYGHDHLGLPKARLPVFARLWRAGGKAPRDVPPRRCSTN